MNVKFNSLVTLRLNNSNNLKYCDVRLNSAKKRILYTKMYNADKLVEYKTEQCGIKYSEKTGLPIVKFFEDTKIKMIKVFHENSTKLRQLLIHNKETDKKYIAKFDANEKVRELMLGYPQKSSETVYEDEKIRISGEFNKKTELLGVFLLNKITGEEFVVEDDACKDTMQKLLSNNQNRKASTIFKINKDGEVFEIKGKSFDKNIETIKFNKEDLTFELDAAKSFKEDSYGIYAQEEKLYLNGINNKLKVYENSEYKSNSKKIVSVTTYVENNDKYQLVEDIIYDSKTNNMLLHEIRTSNNEIIYLAVEMSNDSGYRLCGDYNHGKTINFRNPEKV